MSAAPAPRAHYLTLDAARGVAALLVLLTHIGYFLRFPFLGGGYLAVDFFFLLSGFVVAAAYERRLQGGMGFFGFAVVRARRLYPLYIAGTLVGAVRFLVFPVFAALAVRDPAGISTTFALALVMLPGRVRGMSELFPFNGPSWSLFFEMAANLVYALIARWLSTAVLVAIVALGLAGCLYMVSEIGSLGGGPRWKTFPWGFARVTLSFFGGVLLYRLRGQPFSKPSNMGCLAVLALLAAGLFLTPGVSAWDLAPVLVLFPALVWFGARVEPAGWLAGLAKRAGPWSYALYATHIPVMDLLGRPLRDAHVPKLVITAILILVCSVVAWAADRFWDVPIRRWLADRGRPRTVRPALEPQAKSMADG